MLLILHDGINILDIVRNGRNVNGAIYQEGHLVVPHTGCLYGYYPDQDLSALYSGTPPVLTGKIADLVRYDTQTANQAIDMETGTLIDQAAHPFAGTQEEIGIIRDQLVQILNALGLEPTASFAALNTTAIAEIEKARIEKEAL